MRHPAGFRLRSGGKSRRGKEKRKDSSLGPMMRYITVEVSNIGLVSVPQATDEGDDGDELGIYHGKDGCRRIAQKGGHACPADRAEIRYSSFYTRVEQSTSRKTMPLPIRPTPRGVKVLENFVYVSQSMSAADPRCPKRAKPPIEPNPANFSRCGYRIKVDQSGRDGDPLSHPRVSGTRRWTNGAMRLSLRNKGLDSNRQLVVQNDIPIFTSDKLFQDEPSCLPPPFFSFSSCY